MCIDTFGTTTENEVLAACRLYQVDHVGHADNTSRLIKHWTVLHLEELSLPECLVNRISFKHEWNFDAHVQANDVVILY